MSSTIGFEDHFTGSSYVDRNDFVPTPPANHHVHLRDPETFLGGFHQTITGCTCSALLSLIVRPTSILTAMFPTLEASPCEKTKK
jgi:hypothetical protein